MGKGAHSYKKKWGTSPQGFRLRVPKRMVFFVFGHLSCTDFDQFWNKRHESVSACVHWWKISEFLHRRFSTSQKQLKWVLSIVECLCVRYSSNGTILGNGNQFGG